VTWVYIRSEPTLWTVGFYDPSDRWQPESDHGTSEEAAKRCAWLNRGAVAAQVEQETIERIARVTIDLFTNTQWASHDDLVARVVARLYPAPADTVSRERLDYCVKCGMGSWRQDQCPNCGLAGVWWSDRDPAPAPEGTNG
jgi:hypothetical protein